MPLLVFLPILAFILTSFVFFKKTKADIRFVFVWSALIWMLTAIVIVEGLSLFHVLTKGGVATCWMLAIAGSIVFLFCGKGEFQKIKIRRFKDLSKLDLVFAFLITVIICVVGLIAFYGAPNNWDSMTYHLPRVMHWIQNQSVEHYPTAILRQLYQPPGAEFIILHFQILTDSDRFANFAQWFSMIGCVFVLSLIAKEFGVGKTGQLLTGFLAATIPMGILQGSSTQNDYVASFWLVCFVYFQLRIFRNNKAKGQCWPEIVGMALSLGFGLLTKGTIYIFVISWLIWFFVSGLLKNQKRVFQYCLVIGLICLVVNVGFYTRNMMLFGHPLSAGSEDYINKGGVIGNGISNVIRNAALHIGTPSSQINAFLKDKIIGFHTMMGLNENEVNNSWGEFEIRTPTMSEDIAGNPFHFLLIVCVFIFVFVSMKKEVLLRRYALMIIAAFLLFCMLFKWQLFHSRLHLPLFLLSMPIVAVMVTKMRTQWLSVVLVIIFTLTALPPLFWNERHPIIAQKNIFNTSRMEQYFSYRKFMALPYVLSVKYAGSRANKDVGLLLGSDDWEYPLWVLLKSQNPNVKIWHTNVKNISGRISQKYAENVNVIISEINDPPIVFTWDDKVYLKRQSFSFMSIYENPKP
ncbi:MAG: glycosyltransferase family 39 protein [Candidatus Omnitrophica bacterium]|nr:glycosyltransferase family 39 protein [Candidatus Omnitrophota bacterium]